MKGFWWGLCVCVLLLIIIPVLEYDGRCGLNIMGGFRRDCTLLEFLASSEDFLFGVVALLYYFWWLTPIIVGKTMLTLYGLANGTSKK